MSDAMDAEFGTIAQWTAAVALDLGPEYYVPAASRGSGSPAALDWLADGMELFPGRVLLDSGAGLGGPAAYAARKYSATPVLVEPQEAACRAARTLFDLPVVRASGSALPIRGASVDAAWSLGVLCTTSQQLSLLAELRRIVRIGGFVGLLVFVANDAAVSDVLEDNHFPQFDELSDQLEKAGFDVRRQLTTTDLPTIPADWSQRVGTVTYELEQRYGHTRAWRLAQRQGDTIDDLLARRAITGELYVLK